MDTTVDKMNISFQAHIAAISENVGNINRNDQHNILLWQNKLRNMCNTVEEQHVRHQYSVELLRQMIDKKIEAPFNKKPPTGKLHHFQMEFPAEYEKSRADKTRAEATLGGKKPERKTPELFERSPDKGAFLVGQPVPRCGAFCYLAVVSRQPDT